MDKKELEGKLSKLMDDVPEIEGLIALDAKGSIIVGQTLLEMDLAPIAKATFETFTKARGLASVVSKGAVQAINMSLDNGSCCIVGNEKLVVVSMQGNDAQNSIALLLRYMKALLA